MSDLAWATRMALKAAALASKKAAQRRSNFHGCLPRFVSNKANPRCAISLNRSPFPAGPTFKVRMKRQSKVCAPMRSLVFAKLSDRKTKPTVELMACDPDHD
jgi:hypothetical protein